MSSYRGQLLRVGMEGSGRLYQRAVQQGHGVLSGIGRRVSSLFGLRGPPADTAVRLLNIMIILLILIYSTGFYSSQVIRKIIPEPVAMVINQIAV